MYNTASQFYYFLRLMSFTSVPLKGFSRYFPIMDLVAQWRHKKFHTRSYEHPRYPDRTIWWEEVLLPSTLDMLGTHYRCRTYARSEKCNTTPLVKRIVYGHTVYAVDYKYNEPSDIIDAFICHVETHKLSSDRFLQDSDKYSYSIRYLGTIASIQRSQGGKYIGLLAKDVYGEVYCCMTRPSL